MAVVLRNTGRVDSLKVKYQTLTGINYNDLSLAYEWFISYEKTNKDWYYLIIKSGDVFGDAGTADSLEEAIRKLYARAWLDCMDLDNRFIDETRNKNKFSKESFNDVLKEFGVSEYGLNRTKSPLDKKLSLVIRESTS